MNHAKTSFSTEMFAGAIISVVQYLAPLQYVNISDTFMVLQDCGGYCQPGQSNRMTLQHDQATKSFLVSCMNGTCRALWAVLQQLQAVEACLPFSKFTHAVLQL
jgi:hypothetical protein